MTNKFDEYIIGGSFGFSNVYENYSRFRYNDIDVFICTYDVQKTLNTIIENEIPNLEKIDIISLDIEGGELNCLYGLDIDKYKPSVMVIENVSHSKDITNYLEKYNYVLDKSISYNEYYVHKEFNL